MVQGLVRSTVLETIGTDSLNSGNQIGRPTVDIGIYLQDTPSERYNTRMPRAEVIRRYRLAQDVFDVAGVQLNLLWIKIVQVDPPNLGIPANVMTGSVGGGVADLYEKLRRQKSSLAPEAEAIFEAIIEPDPANDRTVYLVGMEDVAMAWNEELENGEWEERSDLTNALSFPSYSLEDRIPRRLRGVITVQNIFKSEKIIAHELGHKLLNVSHEHADIDPQHAVDAEGGLMVYGEGTDILGGWEGRWHRERLLLSPYIYTENNEGQRVYNQDYEETGHYADPIYGSFIRGPAEGL